MTKQRPADFTFNRPQEERWNAPANRDWYYVDGFNLRRLLEDHGAPAVRFPREIIRHLGWTRRTLLWITEIEGCIVIGKLKYEDPTEVAHDKVDQVRRKLGIDRASDSVEGGEGR